MGASGGIGQPLALLLKQSPLVTELSLYDIVNTPGVAADLSHMDTAAKVKGFTGPQELKDAVKGAQVFILLNLFKLFTINKQFKNYKIFFRWSLYLPVFHVSPE